MAGQKWQTVREIFDAALRQKPELRRKYIIKACKGDKSLLTEVQSLLDSLDDADSFLETPVVPHLEFEPESNENILEKGTNLDHYEIIGPIGAGGMGEVYLALDTKLDRQVAIKILNKRFKKPDANLGRFIKEAKSVSALNHPNILVIHEIGEANQGPYIVSEYIKGKTLRELLRESSLTLAQILDLAIQIATALTAAHEAHLIHRDIKPENIMIRPDGLLKVLDFGLAKLVEENKSILGFDNSKTQSWQTSQGMILGTVNYMSPEQAKGDRVDERTDIFTLGAVIYEMLVGKTPFQGDSVPETFANLINREAPPISSLKSNVPEKLQRILSKMLCKAKDSRYQTMLELLRDLRSFRETLSEEEKRESAQSAEVRNTGELNIVTSEGKKLTAGNTDGYFQTIKRPAVILSLLTFCVISGVMFGVYQYWNLPKPELAQDLYLQGRYYALRENKPDNDRAIQLLEQAVELDPNHALAHAELARAYGTRYFQFEPHQTQWREKSHFELDKAFALKPGLAEGHEIRGFLLWMPANRFPHEQAIAAYQQAVLSNPNLDEPHQQLGKIYLHIGLLEEALAEFRKALEINPSNTMARYRIGIVFQHQGRHEEALLRLKSTPPEINPAIVERDRVWMLISLGRRDEARQLITEMLKNNPTDEGGQFAGFSSLMFALSGNTVQAEREVQNALEKGKGFGHFHHTAYIIACTYAALNKPEEAVRYLQLAADEGYPCYPLFELDLHLDKIRRHPKFQEFLAAQKRQWEYFRTLPKN